MSGSRRSGPDWRSCCSGQHRCWRNEASSRHTGHSSKVLHRREGLVNGIEGLNLLTDLGALGPELLAVCLSERGTVGILVHTGLLGGERRSHT